MTFVRIKVPVLIILLLTFFLLSPFGCSKKEEPVVAKVGKGSITVSDFKNYLSDRSMPRRYRVSKEDIKKRLDEMVLEEVLHQEALRIELDQDPQVRGRIRQMLTQKLMEKVEKEVWSREIEESKLQKYYDEYRDEFNRPAQVRVADIFIAATADAKADLKKRAQSVLAEALAAKKQREGFGNLVRKHSDKHEKYRKGDSGFFDIEGKPVGIDKNLAQAAFKLKRVGNMPEHVIETPEGYHVIMLIGKRSAIERPLDSLRNQIKQRIRREALKKEREAYINGLKNKQEILIDEKIVGKIALEMRKPEKHSASQKSDTQASRHGRSRTPPAFPGQQ